MTDEKLIQKPAPGIAANEGVPTQVANPSRASWRTFVQAAVPYLLAANVALPIIASFLTDYSSDLESLLGPVYGWIVVAVNVAVLVLSLGAKLIALLMAQERVNALVVRHLPFLAPIAPGPDGAFTITSAKG